jgi:hypothetical protein
MEFKTLKGIVMRSYLLSLRGFYQVIFIVAGTVIAAFLIAFACSLFFDTHQLEANTDLSASVYQVMGTVYAILLTFTLWGVWQNFNEATTSVQNETFALLDLVHIVEASTSWKNSGIRAAALNYCERVVKDEWKNISASALNMSQGTHSTSLEIVKEVQGITPQNERENAIFSQTLSLLNNWLDSRRTRILIARGDSAKSLWPVLFTGAIVLFAFHGLFVAKTLGLWAALLFGFSLVIGITFYLIFTLDCPFEGMLSIDSEPFQMAITVLKNKAC